MESSSSSQSTTSTTTNNTTKTLNQNVQGNSAPLYAPTSERGDSTINVLDGGAISKSLDVTSSLINGGAELALKISNNALDTFDNVNERSLQLVGQTSKQFAENLAASNADAFDFVDSASRSDGAKSFDTLVKYGSLAGSAIAISVYLGKK